MRKVLMLGAVLPVLFLTACGDGWEMRSYDGFPYGERTAGKGVEYVRAHMMPKKGPVLKPRISEAAEEVKTDEGNVDKMINSGEKFFRDLQKK